MADEPFAAFLGTSSGESPGTEQTQTSSGSYTVQEPSRKEARHSAGEEPRVWRATAAPSRRRGAAAASSAAGLGELQSAHGSESGYSATTSGSSRRAAERVLELARAREAEAQARVEVATATVTRIQAEDMVDRASDGSERPRSRLDSQSLPDENDNQSWHDVQAERLQQLTETGPNVADVWRAASLAKAKAETSAQEFVDDAN